MASRNVKGFRGTVGCYGVGCRALAWEVFRVSASGLGMKVGG